MRRHGFQKPFNWMQIVTWIIFPILLAHFYLFCTPVLPKPISIPLTIVYTLLAFASAYYATITTLTDSIDGLLYKEKYGVEHPLDVKKKEREMKMMMKNKKKKLALTSKDNLPPPTTATTTNEQSSTLEESNSTTNPQQDTTNDSEPDPEPETKYCWVDQTQVYATSMHCRYCDKCVQKFDHHCMWLNTCIGERNYGYFFKTICLLFAYTAFHLASIATFLVLYFCKNPQVRKLSRGWIIGMKGGERPLVIINICFTVFLLSVVSLIFQLLSFHLMLHRKQLTTYEFILEDGEKKREERKLDAKIEERRGDEIIRLNRMGNRTGIYKLKMFGWDVCKPCDPIRRVVMKEEEGRKMNEEVNGGEGGEGGDAGVGSAGENGLLNGKGSGSLSGNGSTMNGKDTTTDEENGLANGHGGASEDSDDVEELKKENGNGPTFIKVK